MRRKVRISPSNAAPWHPGYPFRPGGGRTRTVLSWATLGVLMGMIGAYAYVTDSRRVKRLAEETLSDAIGGVVHVGRARLSIFEGLRLEDVTVDVDAKGAEDSRLLHAQSVYISLPWLKLAEGDLSKTRIVVVEPHVYLVVGGEGEWNLSRLRPRSSGASGQPWFKLSLPEIVLREAKVTYGEWDHGRVAERDTKAVEGRAALVGPGEAGGEVAGNVGKYVFAFKARGSADHPGPTLSGSLDPASGQLSGRLRDFDLNEFMGMLPEGVRRWCARHEVAGDIDLPELSVEPAAEGHMRFKVVVRFGGGSMAFRPEELTTEKLTPGLPSIRFSDVHGELAFDDSGVQLREMELTHEGNTLRVSGRFDGYGESAPFNFRVACDKLNLPEHPAMVPSLPADAREVYDRFLPSGEGSFRCDIARRADGKVSVDGRLDITNGQMTFDEFPSRCYGLTGALVFKSSEPGATRLELVDLRGHGRPGTPNEKADVRVDGWMFPVEEGMQIDVNVTGKGLTGDDVLVAAMPEQVREALKAFRLPGKEAPEFSGDFACRVMRDRGEESKWHWPIDIQLRGGRGRFDGFPYPLENVTGEILIGDGAVKLTNIRSSRGGSELAVDGKVTYRDTPPGKLLYDVGIEARHVPLDATLLEAIPEDKRPWLTKLGLAGNLDMSGRVSGLEGRYDLGIRMDHGTLQPNLGASPNLGAPPNLAPPLADAAARDKADKADKAKLQPWTATDVTAEVRLTPDSLTIERVLAKRGDGRISASGKVVWPDDKLAIDVTADARSLPLDAELRQILPDDAANAWDAVHPDGAADVALHFADGPMHVEITPLGLSVTPTVLPVKLSDVHGKVTVDDDRIVLSGLTATRGATRVSMSGTGSTRASGTWDVQVAARDLDVDAELRAAMPSVIKGTIDGMDLRGRGDIDVRRLRFTPALGDGPGKGSDADFSVTVVPTDMTLSMGFPAHVTAGRLDFDGAVRDDRLDHLDGTIRVRAADLADRPLSNFSATVTKRAGEPILRLDDVGGTLAEGQLAGSARVSLPDSGSASYVVQLVLRDADVRALAGKTSDDVSGRMQASLRLEGEVDDPGSRRGTGDISVVGDHMARIPVLLGLVQVANLSLPTKNAFNNATAKYSMNGARINFDQMAIRAPGLEMVGTGGHIDLDARTVLLTFAMAPPDLPRIPILSDLTDRVRRELLKIEIRGTIDNPKVSAKSFDSFTTTVREVLEQQGKNASPNK